MEYIIPTENPNSVPAPPDLETPTPLIQRGQSWFIYWNSWLTKYGEAEKLRKIHNTIHIDEEKHGPSVQMEAFLSFTTKIA